MRRKKWMRLKEGEVISLHRLWLDNITTPSWCENFGATLALFHAGHMFGTRYVLCQSQSNYAFLPEWTGRCICSGMSPEARRMRLNTSISVCCALMRLDTQERCWRLIGLIIPQVFVYELVDALTAFRVVMVRKTRGMHIVEPLPDYYARAEPVDNPVILLREFAYQQLRFSNYILHGYERNERYDIEQQDLYYDDGYK